MEGDVRCLHPGALEPEWAIPAQLRETRHESEPTQFPCRANSVGTTALLPAGLLSALAAEAPAPPDLSDWDKVRAQFVLDPAYLHFASFFIASHPAPVRAAIEGYRRAIDANPCLVIERGLFEALFCSIAIVGDRPRSFSTLGRSS